VTAIIGTEIVLLSVLETAAGQLESLLRTRRKTQETSARVYFASLLPFLTVPTPIDIGGAER
jgi:hypothetical protein